MDGHDGGFGDHDHDGHDAYGNADYHGAGQSTWEALSIGYSHQGHNPGHFSGFGIIAHGNHCGGVSGGAAHQAHTHAGRGAQTQPRAERCDVTPIQRSFHGERRMYVAHVVAHGDVDILSHLQRICKKHDVIRLDTYRPSMNGEDRKEQKLADDEPWVPPYDLENQPPAGYYPGATGTTRFVKQVWQVGRRPSLWEQGFVKALRAIRKHDWVKDPVYDPEAKTYFDIGIVTWNYRETGDHDTLITIRIQSQQVWQRYFGAYGYKRLPFQQHQEAAGKIIQELMEALKCAEPNEDQKRNRQFFAFTKPGLENGSIPAPQPDEPPAPTPGPTPAPVDGCPPVPAGEVQGSGVDLDSVVTDPVTATAANAASGATSAAPGPVKVNVVVTVPK